MSSTSDSLAAEFLHYNCWANLQLIDALCRLSPEQLEATAAGVYGNIYDTVKHIVRSEAGYYRRISGVTLEPSFDWDAAPPLADVRPYAEQVGRALIEASGKMQPGDILTRDWEDPEWQAYPAHFKAAGLLIQVLNHGDEHRTNITTILAQQGIEPPDLDGWEYMRLNPDRMAG